MLGRTETHAIVSSWQNTQNYKKEKAQLKCWHVCRDVLWYQAHFRSGILSWMLHYLKDTKPSLQNNTLGSPPPHVSIEKIGRNNWQHHFISFSFYFIRFNCDYLLWLTWDTFCCIASNLLKYNKSLSLLFTLLCLLPYKSRMTYHICSTRYRLTHHVVNSSTF